jgi:hypothetical protein
LNAKEGVISMTFDPYWAPMVAVAIIMLALQTELWRTWIKEAKDKKKNKVK